MKTLIATTLVGMLAMGTGAVFAQQTPPPTEPQTPPPAMNPAHPGHASLEESCAKKFPVFSRLDARHNGEVTKQEARRVPQLEKDFKKADTNHNGKLSQAEYSAWVEDQCGHGPAR